MEILLRLIFFIFLFGVAPIVQAVTIIPRPENSLGLMGYWTFDGVDMISNVNDRSGNNNDGRLTSTISTTTVPGKWGQSLNFDGTGDVRGFTASPVAQAAPISACLWVKPDDTTSRTVVADRDSTTNGWQFGVNRTTVGNLSLIHDASVVQVASGVTAGEWNHVCYSWDSVTTLTSFYNNGTLRGSSNLAAEGETRTGTPFRIGHSAATGFSTPFKGAIDDVRVYSRVLTGTEITALYRSGSSRVGNSSTLTQGSVLANGLTVHSSFDGADVTDARVYDRAGGTSGYFSGGATSSAKTLGILGQAFTFDGSNDYVYFSYDPPNTSQTMSVWVKTTSSSKSIMGFASLHPTGGSNDRQFYINAAGTVTYRVWDGSEKTRTSTSRVNDGRWHFITGRYEEGVGISLFVDGVQEGTTLSTGAPFNYSPPAYLSVGKESISAYLPGTIDDVRFYNRALSAAEIKQLYQLGGGVQNASSATLTAGTPLASGLVGHWTFDGAKMTQNVADSSGLGNNGFLSGFTSTTTAIGKLGQALLLDGTDDRVNMGDVASLRLTGSMTISTWIKPDSLGYSGGGQPGIMINKLGFQRAYNFALNTTGTVIINIASDSTTLVSRASTGVLTTDRWYHVVGVYDSSAQTLSTYINGALSNGTLTGTVPASQFSDNSQPVWIGGRNDFATQYFDGTIDDVRIYNRALSAAEVLQLYNLGK